MPTPTPSQQGMSGSPPHKKPALILVAGLVIGAVAGYGLGNIGPATETNSGYDAGYEAARMKLQESGLFLETEQETDSLAGVITEIKGDTLTIESELPSLNPLDAVDAPLVRTVKVDEATNIYRIVLKSVEVLQEEFQPAPAVGDPAADINAQLEPFTREPVEFSEISIGMNLIFSADHNIFNEESFTATEIQLPELIEEDLTLLPDTEALPAPIAP
jgi:hypothetical protein